MSDCRAEGCVRPPVARQLCSAHYSRYKTGKDINIPLRPYRPGMACQYPGCFRKARSLGLCIGHYQRAKIQDGPLTSICQHCSQVFAFPELRKGGYNRKWCFTCYPDGDKAAFSLLRKFNLSRPEFNEMLIRQNGMCAIASCKQPAKVVDHDHQCCPVIPTCGRCTRGLLCVTHNVHLAWEENPSWKAEAQAYLKKFNVQGLLHETVKARLLLAGVLPDPPTVREH